MIRFACPRCGRHYNVPLAYGGKKTNCPACGQRWQVPMPPPNRTILARLVHQSTPPPSASARQPFPFRENPLQPAADESAARDAEAAGIPLESSRSSWRLLVIAASIIGLAAVWAILATHRASGSQPRDPPLTDRLPCLFPRLPRPGHRDDCPAICSIDRPSWVISCGRVSHQPSEMGLHPTTPVLVPD